MIKINLLNAEKSRAVAAARVPAFDIRRHQLTIGCALILLASAGVIGWRYYSLAATSAQLDVAIAEAQQETVRLHSVMEEVQAFEQRRTQLQQRVGLIEQLRRDQTGPVHLLDQISLALPPMMWLTDLKQSPGATDVVIEGRCTRLTGLSDFVANLEASGYFKKSVEIVGTQVEEAPGGELVRFSVRAEFQRPGAGVPVAPAGTLPVSPGKPAT